MHPTMIHAWKKALLQGASGVFERVGGKRTPEINEEQMKDLHAKIGELAVANDFLARKLKHLQPWQWKRACWKKSSGGCSITRRFRSPTSGKQCRP